MTPAIDFRLCLVTDRHLCAPRSLPSVVREACEAGVRAVQLRAKDLDAVAIDALAETLHGITARCGAALFVNQAHPSSVVPGAGLHFPESIVISRPDPGVLISASAHSHKSAVVSAAAGADLVIFGPVYGTQAKTRFGPPQGLERLGAVADAVDVPVFAIGGVTPARVRECLDAGAQGVAVMGGIMAADDVAAAVSAFGRALGEL